MSAGAGTSQGPPLDAVKVWIRDPEKHEGPNKLGIKTSYFTYLVRTESTLPGMRADGTEVRRRFSEFDVSANSTWGGARLLYMHAAGERAINVWMHPLQTLHKVLKAQYRGYIIPPLPEKSFIESKLGQEDFVRLRRADLQVGAEGPFLLGGGEAGDGPVASFCQVG